MEVRILERTEKAVDLLDLFRQVCDTEEQANECHLRALKRFGMIQGDTFLPGDAIVELEHYLNVFPRAAEAIDAVTAIISAQEGATLSRKRSFEKEAHELRIIEVLTPVHERFCRIAPEVAKRAKNIIEKSMKELE